MVVVVLMLATIGIGATALGKAFRYYSIATLAVLLAFGALTGLDAPRIAANEPTPWVGVWERINIASHLLWVVVLAISLMQAVTRTPAVFRTTLRTRARAPFRPA